MRNTLFRRPGKIAQLVPSSRAAPKRHRRPLLCLEPLEDRTLPSVSLVMDIDSTITHDSNPTGFAVVNGTTFFSATDGLHGAGLWKSDGTAAGTVLLSAGGAVYLTNVNGTLFFARCDAKNGTELWKSDGT